MMSEPDIGVRPPENRGAGDELAAEPPRSPGMRGVVLVVDDDPDAADAIAASLRARGFVATAEIDSTRALAHGIAEDIDVVLTDLRMQTFDGLALCEQFVAARPEVPVVLLTAHATFDAVTAALRSGAFDFVSKPADPDVLCLHLDRAVEHHRLRTEVTRLRTAVAESKGFAGLIGESHAIQLVREQISRLAPTLATVLITGESGTGKELVARAIHDRGAQQKGPFVAVNCAAVPAALLESELFGHTRGAFTDARAARRGLFLEAQGGTLFLDEVGEMPLEMQAKLLRALQERSVRPVGGQVEMAFDARIIAATNRDLEEDIERKRFREDLYYRIHVCAIRVPPLREREGDVPILAATFVSRFARKHHKAVTGITGPALARLVRWTWPGNVRELENSIEHAVAMTEHDSLVIDDLPERVRNSRPRIDELLPSVRDEIVPMEEMKRRYARRVLELVQGNKSHAARMLGFDRRTLYRTLEESTEGLPDAGEALVASAAARRS